MSAGDKEGVCTCGSPEPLLGFTHAANCPVYRKWQQQQRERHRQTFAPGRPDERRQHGDRETE